MNGRKIERTMLELMLLCLFGGAALANSTHDTFHIGRILADDEFLQTKDWIFQVRLGVFRLTVPVDPFISRDSQYKMRTYRGAFETGDLHRTPPRLRRVFAEPSNFAICRVFRVKEYPAM